MGDAGRQMLHGDPGGLGGQAFPLGQEGRPQFPGLGRLQPQGQQVGEWNAAVRTVNVSF